MLGCVALDLDINLTDLLTDWLSEKQWERKKCRRIAHISASREWSPFARHLSGKVILNFILKQQIYLIILNSKCIIERIHSQFEHVIAVFLTISTYSEFHCKIFGVIPHKAWREHSHESEYVCNCISWLLCDMAFVFLSLFIFVRLVGIKR